MIYINQVYYYVDGIAQNNKWEVVKNLEIYFAPLVISINQEFHDFMKEFFLQSQGDQASGQKAIADSAAQMKAKVDSTNVDA